MKVTKDMNKWSELLLGLILIIAPILIAFYSQAWGAWNFWTSAGTFFKGGLFWFILMIGILFVLLGLSDLKETSRSNSSKKPQMPQTQTMPQSPLSQSPAKLGRKKK